MIYRRGFSRTVLIVLASAGICSSGNAADDQPGAAAKVTVEAVDPNRPLAEIMKNNSGDCHIIYQDGKPYRVCPFRIPVEIQRLIKAQEAK
jgi:hypothetical protein